MSDAAAADATTDTDTKGTDTADKGTGADVADDAKGADKGAATTPGRLPVPRSRGHDTLGPAINPNLESLGMCPARARPASKILRQNGILPFSFKADNRGHTL